MPTHHLLRGLCYADMKNHEICPPQDEEFLRSVGASVLQLTSDNWKKGAELARRAGTRIILADNAGTVAADNDAADLLLQKADVFYLWGQDENLAGRILQWRQESRPGSVLVCVARLSSRAFKDITTEREAVLDLFNAAAAAWKEGGNVGR